MPLDTAIGSLSSMSPNTSIKPYAMFFCCDDEQWFSIDRISGYLAHKSTQQILNRQQSAINTQVT